MAMPALEKSLNPYVDLINKRVRNYRKKLDKIEKIQTALAAGTAVNAEQEGTLQRRGEVTERLAEYEKLRRDMLGVEDEEAAVSLTAALAAACVMTAAASGSVEAAAAAAAAEEGEGGDGKDGGDGGKGVDASVGGDGAAVEISTQTLEAERGVAETSTQVESKDGGGAAGSGACAVSVADSADATDSTVTADTATNTAGDSADEAERCVTVLLRTLHAATRYADFCSEHPKYKALAYLSKNLLGQTNPPGGERSFEEALGESLGVARLLLTGSDKDVGGGVSYAGLTRIVDALIVHEAEEKALVEKRRRAEHQAAEAAKAGNVPVVNFFSQSFREAEVRTQRNALGQLGAIDVVDDVAGAAGAAGAEVGSSWRGRWATVARCGNGNG